MATIWLDVAWGGNTATKRWGGVGGVVAGVLDWLFKRR
jgi:hypothetical protein